MKFAINPATTMPYDFQTDITAFAAAGFDAIELWLGKVEAYLASHSIEQASDLLVKSKLKAVSACAVDGLMLGEPMNNVAGLQSFKKRLDLCQKLDRPLLIVPTDFPEHVEPGMYRLAERNLQMAGKIAADYNVKLAVEFIQGSRFVATLSTATQLVRNVGQANVGIILDLAHFWMNRSHIEDLENLRADEILIVHLDDVEANLEAELITDYHRTFPGCGRGIEKRLIPTILKTGFKGYFSLEIFNRNIWGRPINKICGAAAESFKYVENTFLEGRRNENR